MPIYEFACPTCRKIYSFLSRRMNPDRNPACPDCGGKQLKKQVTSFAMIRGGQGDESGADAGDEEGGGAPLPDLDDPKVAHAMEKMERSLGGLDENNPRELGRMLRQMQAILPADKVPRDFDRAIRRLEAGEDPDTIEADMGEVFDQWRTGKSAGRKRDDSRPAYTRDPRLHEY